MNVPEGALTLDQGLELKRGFPHTKIYFVSGYHTDDADRWGIIHDIAKNFFFSCGPPEHYFTNYLLAIGYALRFKGKKS